MSTNTKTRTLRAVPDPATPRTETEEKLWQALRNTPDSTAAALSTAAGIGRSTAPKILTRWEKDGLVARTTGIADGGSRAADRWSITIEEQTTDDQPTEKPARLAPGALGGMVEDYLRDNVGEFSPNTIGKALNRSSGAVYNALERLVKSGVATRTSERPKKYSLTATAPTAAE